MERLVKKFESGSYSFIVEFDSSHDPPFSIVADNGCEPYTRWTLAELKQCKEAIEWVMGNFIRMAFREPLHE